MKTVKSTAVDENVVLTGNKTEGKVRKNKNLKKIKDGLSKIKNLNLAPKYEAKKNGSDEIKKSKKNLSGAKETNQELKEEIQNQIKTKEKGIKPKKKTKPGKEHKNTASMQLTEDETENTEKKEKLVHKLKKQGKKNKVDNENDRVASTTNTIVKTKASDSEVTEGTSAISSKVLTKKEKKAQKRQIIKDQKLQEKQTRDPALEAATVFVGNMPVNTKRKHLIRIFKDFGPVSSIRLRSAGGAILFKHKTRKTAGSLNAYVVLKSKEMAEKSITLNGMEFNGHHLRITLAANKELYTEKEEQKRTVFIGNLKYSATEESLREIFSNCGEINYVRCIRDGDKGCKGVAYVCFKSADAVSLAVELNGTIVDERPINVERFNVKKLGAKKAREESEQKGQSHLSHGKQKLNEDKKGKQNKSARKNNREKLDDGKKVKKGEFRGVKVEGLKKKQKSKKKKSNDQMIQLAKKIAPKQKI